MLADEKVPNRMIDSASCLVIHLYKYIYYVRRHKQAVEEKLSEMRKKQQADAKNTKDEQHWLKKMEEAALKV